MINQNTFYTEIDTAQKYVLSELNGLTEPLLSLVKNQTNWSMPTLLASVALAAGFASSDTDQIQEQRTLFAAAVEMLQLAIDVHQLIVIDASSDEPEFSSSLIGGTILAGDYCFSRAAALSTRTGNPEVVGLFAQALKDVSENHLRHLFDRHDIANLDTINLESSSAVKPYDKTADLCKMSAKAAAKLAHLSLQEEESAIQCGIALANPHERLESVQSTINRCAPFQQERWSLTLSKRL